MSELENDLNKKMKVRKKLLIYPSFQLTLVFANSSVICLMFILSDYLNSIFFKGLKESAITANIPPNHVYFETLKVQYENINRNSIIVFVLGFLLSNVLILILSHRLAGPLVRLKNYFKNIVEVQTEIHPLKFRNGDFFSDLPPLINQAFDKIQNKK